MTPVDNLLRQLDMLCCQYIQKDSDIFDYKGCDGCTSSGCSTVDGLNTVGLNPKDVPKVRKQIREIILNKKED